MSTVGWARSHSSGHRQLSALSEELVAHHRNLLHCTKARRLSRGMARRRFFELRKEIDLFVSSKRKSLPPLTREDWIGNPAFLVDIANPLNSEYFSAKMLTSSHTNI